MTEEKEKVSDNFKSMSQEDRIEYISQKLFNKPSKDIKYLYTTGYIHFILLEEELARSGLYAWLNVFKGDVKYPRDVPDYSKYDIVQVNMSGQDIHLINDIREQLGEDSKTLLVVNNDYTTEMWQGAFGFTTAMKRELSGADMLFGTEYFQTSALSEISDRKCFVIPHPSDIRRMKSLEKVVPKDIISTIWRRYDNHYYVPSLCVRNHGLTTQLLGYDDKKDPKTHVCTALYDYVISGTNFFDFQSQLRESKIIFNPFTFHSYDRTAVECAALGIPVVGSNRTQSMNVCYPFTVVDPYDVTKSRQLINRLLEDKEFYKKVVDTAVERSEFYNLLNSKDRYLVALFDSVSKGDRKKAGKDGFKKVPVVDVKGEDVYKTNLKADLGRK